MNLSCRRCGIPFQVGDELQEVRVVTRIPDDGVPRTDRAGLHAAYAHLDCGPIIASGRR